MRPSTLYVLVLLCCLASWSAVSASRLAPEDQQHLSTAADRMGGTTSTAAADSDAGIDKKHKKKSNGSADYEDEDPGVRSHWALLAAGSAGWFNYRHQADVFHAYQVLVAGGYRRDHIIVMAADDIAQEPDNPMPGKVFNAPGGPNVYDGVRIDYRGADVTAENFLSVLLGDAAAMAGKGSGRVVDSGPHDKVFVFYSDHGAAGVLGMPNGPFLYADEFIKTLKKKHSRKGFREAVLYIEACESGSMFEGLLGNDLNIYVTTAANAIESSWATYCPTFFAQHADDTNTANAALNALTMVNGGSAASGSSGSNGGSSGGWKGAVLRGLGWLQQQLGRITGAPTPAGPPAAAAAADPKPASQFTTCLGDLYSVAWMEDAELSDLTQETLLQQYKKIKVRTSQNFTYDQGSHVMQYGDLDMDKELSGDYEGMNHNGTKPTPTWPSDDWMEAWEAATAQQQQRQASMRLRKIAPASSNALKVAGSSPGAHTSGKRQKQRVQQVQHHSVLQRDADLVPLAAAAQHSPCPHKRAAAAAALQQATAARQALETTARAAVTKLLKQPGLGYVMMTNLGGPQGLATAAGQGAQQQQQQQWLGEPSLLMGGDAVGVYAEALMGPLPSRAGQALVGDWECLRSMVQAWEGQCGQLDQYGMKLTRLFANLCNAGLQPLQLAASLDCKALP